MSEILLQNSNKTTSLEVHSSDGDSIQLMPNAVQRVDAKFNWRLPPDVSEFKPKQTVFGKKGVKEVSKQDNIDAQAVDVSEPRVTVTPSPIPVPPTAATKA